jgi:twitching motility protein PilT
MALSLDQFKEVLDILFQQGGSDVHISNGRVPAIRVSKELLKLTSQPVPTKDDMISFLEEMVGPEKTEKFLKEQEIDFSYTHKGKNRFRGNAFVHKQSISLALRLIPGIKTFEELNLPKALEKFVQLKQGFFLIVGPVGQGKTTAIASMIEYVNQTRSEHILTIENPIEYVFENKMSVIDQREVGIDTESFEQGLWSAFRQDANIIMIGEMRTPKTMAAAVTAAETGHLVLSTLHTNNASQTIDRIIDSFPATQQNQIRIQLANSLAGIMSLRLVPKISGGLVPAYELLINTKAVANLIRESRTHEIDIVIETGREHGMIDMNHSLATLVREGHISIENAQRYSLNVNGLNNILGN